MSHLRKAAEKLDEIYYTYEIVDWDDFLASTLERRIKKAQQAKANHIYIACNEQYINWAKTEVISKLQLLLIELKKHFLFLSLELSLKHTSLLHLSETSDLITDLYIKIQNSHNIDLIEFDFIKKYKIALLFCPRTKKDFLSLMDAFQISSELGHQIFWRFEPYNPDKKYFLKIKEIFELKDKFEKKYKTKLRTIPKMEIHNNHISANYELEAIQSITWQLRTEKTDLIQLSLIIPN